MTPGQCSLNCSRWERVQVNVQHLNTGLNQVGEHIPTEQHADLDQHAVLVGCEWPVTYQGDILNCWGNPQIEELDWHLQVQILYTKSHSDHTIFSESLDVNPYLFFHFFSYSECCAFGFALSVCGVKINVMDFHIAFPSHIQEGAYSNISQDTEFPELCFMFSLAILGRYVDSTLKCAITTSTSFPGYFHLPIIWWYVIWINDVFCSQRNTEYHLVCKSKYCNNPIVNFKTVSSTI